MTRYDDRLHGEHHTDVRWSRQQWARLAGQADSEGVSATRIVKKAVVHYLDDMNRTGARERSEEEKS